MDTKEEEFLKRLQAAFKMEAKERVQSISAGLIDLEKESTGSDKEAIIEIIFREAHSLKGAARAVNMADVEAVCQALEGVFSLLKRGQLGFSTDIIDVLYKTLDFMEKVIAPDKEKNESETDLVSDLVAQLNGIASGKHGKIKSGEIKSEEKVTENAEFVTSVEAEVKNDTVLNNTDKTIETEKPDRQQKKIEPHDLSDMVRISTSKLDTIFLQAEEMISLKNTSRHTADEVTDLLSIVNRLLKEWIRFSPEINLLSKGQQNEIGRHSSKLFGFLDLNVTQVKAINNLLLDLSKQTEQHHNSIDLLVDNLIDNMKKVLMLPFSWLLEIFPKMVRDLSKDQDKEVDLMIQGNEIEIDRRILEEMKAPFIHLLRNCIDHGIELSGEREKNGKPRRGTIKISIGQKDGNKVEILVSDDGKGINAQKVKETAIAQGFLSHEEAEKLEEKELISFIFQSDISTSPIITDISGRGLGLAILKESIEKLGGSLSVETDLGKGSLFKIVLPLTIATFRGIFAQVKDQIFVIPTVNVERVVRIKKSDIISIENKDAIKFNDQIISLVQLEEVLEFSQMSSIPENVSTIPERKSEFLILLVINVADKQIAFSVDKVLNEDEVLVKSLGKQLTRVKNIAGITINGSGKAAAILNVYDLMKSAVNISSSSLKQAVKYDQDEVKSKSKSILIAEDSITSRMLIKNILESSGYVVTTAVDGMDAYTKLKEGAFELVVSDVEMPRLNGFELTLKIRKDKIYSHLPVVLVTGLGSREDRERGIDVGANAYIVKSDFDQSNLLSVIDSLI